MEAENPVENPVTMPGRNGGTLKRGGTNPNAGRPPEEVRKLGRDLGYRVLEDLSQIQSQGGLKGLRNKLAVADLALKYGLGSKQEVDLHVDDVREKSDSELDAEIAALEGREAAAPAIESESP